MMKKTIFAMLGLVFVLALVSPPKAHAGVVIGVGVGPRRLLRVQRMDTLRCIRDPTFTLTPTRRCMHAPITSIRLMATTVTLTAADIGLIATGGAIAATTDAN